MNSLDQEVTEPKPKVWMLVLAQVTSERRSLCNFITLWCLCTLLHKHYSVTLQALVDRKLLNMVVLLKINIRMKDKTECENRKTHLIGSALKLMVKSIKLPVQASKLSSWVYTLYLFSFFFLHFRGAYGGSLQLQRLTSFSRATINTHTHARTPTHTQVAMRRPE